MLPQFALALLALLPSVAAHGFVTHVVIDGTIYYGNLPQDVAGSNSSASPIRQIFDIGPVKGASNPDLNCGQSAKLASLVVPANPGSSIQVWWGDPSGGWPHNTGPFMTYMALCGNTTCDQYNGSDAQWFKIDEIGRKPDGSTWYQQDIMNGSPVTFTLPPNVAPGDYLLRHEIIALHLAQSEGGAEFYPSCTQLRIGGSQTGTPNQTVLFPGAYSDTDPGIFDPSIYDPNSNYIFPGPPVSNIASLSDMSTTNGSQSNSTYSVYSAASSATATSSGHSPKASGNSTGSGAQPTQTSVSSSSSVCRLKKRDVTLTKRSSLAQHKRRTGFMRALRDAIRHS